MIIQSRKPTKSKVITKGSMVEGRIIVIMTQVINPIAPNDALGGSFRISYHAYGQKQINHENWYAHKHSKMISLNFF